MVITTSLGFAEIPINLIRRPICDLQTARSESELMAQAQTVVENVRKTRRTILLCVG